MENSSKDGNTSLPASREICMQANKHQLELDVEQETGSKLGKEYVKTVYCHPAYLTYINKFFLFCFEFCPLNDITCQERVTVIPKEPKVVQERNILSLESHQLIFRGKDLGG